MYMISDIEALAEKFERRALLKQDWTHAAHMIVAFWYIYNYEYHEAICKLRSGIILLNQSHRTENHGSSGYHETLTIFWCKVISTYLKSIEGSSLDDIVNNFLNSPLADRQLPFKFYNKEKLLTSEYRAIYKTEEIGAINTATIKNIMKMQ